MKILFTFKTPDVLYYPAKEYAESLAFKNSDIINSEYDGDEGYYISNKIEEFKRIASKWIENGEYITLEIDTELNTCKVV